MVECWLPYGKTEVHVSVPMKNLLDLPVIQADVSRDPEKLLLESIQTPVECLRLRDMATKGKMVAVSLEGDLPSSHAGFVVERVLRELFEAQIPPEDIALIISPGTAGSIRTNLWDQLKPFGDFKIRILEHTWRNENMKEIGRTTAGTSILLNRDFVEADIRVVISEVKPDLLTGYSGFNSVVFPGLSSLSSIASSMRNTLNRKQKPTSPQVEPLSQESKEVSQLLKLDFAISIVSDPAGRPVRAFSGNPEASQRMALSVAEHTFGVPMSRQADIAMVSSGGYPYDRTLSRASIAVCNLAHFCQPEGQIFMIAECSEGLGDPMFYSYMRQHRDLKSMEKGLAEQWSLGGELALRLRAAIEGRKLTLISVLPDYLVRSLGFKTGRTANDALSSAASDFTGTTKVVVAPDGSSILPISEA